jgi:SNF2 family DNA or RNA helicase
MTKKSLRDYQLVDLTFYMMNERCANLSDPGTGKTPPTCVYMDYLWNDKGVRTMWVMPKSLLKKNVDELLEFTRLTRDDIVIYDGTPKQREKLRDTSDAKVWLMGFRRFADEWKDLKRLHEDFDALIVDEIHMGFGGHESGQTAAMYRSMKFLKYFVPLTGTLINGKLSSAYPTIHVIEPRYYGSYEGFLAQHAVKDYFGKVVGWKNHEKIARIFAKHTIKRAFADVYGVNEVVTQVELVPMSTKQRQLYDDFEDKAILDLGDRFLSADGVAAVETIRLRQIMAHPEELTLPTDWDDDGKPTSWKNYNLMGKGEHTGKDERLLVHLADHRNTGAPLLIYAAFKKEIDRMEALCIKEGFRVGKIHGGVSTKRRAEIDEGFRAGAIDVVVASPETAAVGYNWGHVDHIIFASIDYKDSNYIQARRRAERGVREKPLRVTVLEYEKSVDQKIFAIVQEKSESARKVDPTLEKVSLVKDAPPPPEREPRMVLNYQKPETPLTKQELNHWADFLSLRRL